MATLTVNTIKRQLPTSPRTLRRMIQVELHGGVSTEAGTEVSNLLSYDEFVKFQCFPHLNYSQECVLWYTPIQMQLAESSTTGCISAVAYFGPGSASSYPVPLLSIPTAETTKEVPVRPFAEMPGPKGLPVVGTLWDYLKKDGFRFNEMFKVMQKRSQEFGPIYKEKIAHISSVVVSDPAEYAKLVHAEGKHKYPHRLELEPMAYYRKRRGLSLGTVNSQGEEWHRHRSVLSKKMLRPKEVEDYCDSMNTVGNDFMGRMRALLSAEGHIPQLEYNLFKWAMESIGTVLLDSRIGCLEEKPSKEAEEFLANLLGFFKTMQPLMYNVPLYKLFPTQTWRTYEQHADALLDIGLRYVNRRVESLKKEAAENDGVHMGKSSLLTYLISQKSLTPEEANSHVVDMMMGAIETTSNATIWCLYMLATNPEAQRAFFEEVSALLPNKAEITAEKLRDFPYVKACLKETFRLFPITFATSRIIPEDLEIGGYLVPAGSHVQANLYGMGRDPALFPDPEEFKPERWLRDPSEDSVKAYASLPWGHGSRMCLGRRLAQQEIYIVLTKIIQNFRLEYREEPVQPVLNTVMTPDRPVKLIFIPRRSTQSDVYN